MTLLLPSEAPPLRLVRHAPAEDFRHFFRRHAAGVAIITASSPAGPVGFTASSLASVSSDPPMVSFNISHTSSSWSALQEVDHVAVHRLTADDADLAAVFAQRGAPRFESTAWAPGPHGVPVLACLASWLLCSIASRIEAGDSTLLIATVHSVEKDEPTDPEPQPLVWSTGAFGRAHPLRE